MSSQKELDIQAQKDFEFTQGIRKNMVISLIAKGPLPEAREDSQVLLQTMRDMDTQNIQRMRIKVEEEGNGNMQNMAAMVSHVLREVNPSAFSFPSQHKDVTDVMAKALPATILPAETVPGELAVDPPQGDYHAFIARMKS